MLTRKDSTYLDNPRRWLCPPVYSADCMQRVEEGWEWIVSTAKGQPLSDLKGRLSKGNQMRSAVEEILLARGFVRVFGRDAVTPYPRIPPTDERAELMVAKRRIRELETELAIHRRATELLKEKTSPKKDVRGDPSDGRRGASDRGCLPSSGRLGLWLLRMARPR